ncbi:MAG: FHA domain-containing protein [bacterium]
MALRFKLGRSESCSLKIDEDSISIEHAVLFDFGDHLRIEDVSRNGTYLVRRGIRRKLTRYAVEVLQDEDLLYFGFYDQPFPVVQILKQVQKLRHPVGSQKIRCAVHGVIYLESNKCPLCPK